MGVGMGGDERARRTDATSQNPASFRWLRSIMIFSALHSRTKALPRSVRPGPVSPVEGKRNGTPWPKMVGRLQTGPTERRPIAWKEMKRVEVRADGFGALEVQDPGDRARLHRGADFGGGAAPAEAALRGALHPQEVAEHLDGDGLGEVWSISAGRGRS
jgi:hypothetical protein